MRTDKVVFVVAMALFSTVVIAIAGISLKGDSKLAEELEQKERKIEALQEENASLHDELWNLHQTMMKDSD